MEISLNSDLNQFIKEQMATGLYNSVNDVIQEALALFKIKKSVSQQRIEALNKDLEEGLKDLEEGRYSDGDEFFKELIAKYE